MRRYIILLLLTIAVMVISSPRPEANTQGDYIDVIKPTKQIEPEEETQEEPELLYEYNGWTPEEFKLLGVIRWNGWRYTYYSEKVLAGKRLKIPNRHSDEYFVRDVENNICVASSDLKWGSYVETPFGMGRVYDSGCSHGTIDIYVSGRWGQ